MPHFCIHEVIILGSLIGSLKIVKGRLLKAWLEWMFRGREDFYPGGYDEVLEIELQGYYTYTRTLPGLKLLIRQEYGDHLYVYIAGKHICNFHIDVVGILEYKGGA